MYVLPFMFVCCVLPTINSNNYLSVNHFSFSSSPSSFSVGIVLPLSVVFLVGVILPLGIVPSSSLAFTTSSWRAVVDMPSAHSADLEGLK